MGTLGEMFLGTLPSIISNTITNPLERLRIIFQTQDAKYRSEKYQKYSFDVKRLVKEQGIQGLFRGNLVSCTRLYAGPLISDLSLSFIWGCMPKYDPKTELAQYQLVTALTGFLHTPLFVAGMMPLDYLHTRLSADTGTKPEFDGVLDCIKKTLKGPDGFKSFFKGWFSSFLSIFPYRMVAVTVFNALFAINPWAEDQSLPGLLAYNFISQVAVLSGMVASYPFITIKSRVQMEATVPYEQRLYKGEWDCFKRIVKEEGIVGLFCGLKVNVLKGVVGAMILSLIPL